MQTIYIGPEDDLTSVRERLQNVESRHVTLVIPAQTQLRSHVAWKLLHARAREMGKDVLIVSSDPQVRSVAQAVKFKVAQSLEAPPSKPRQMSRSVRSSPPGRSRPASRKTVEGRGPSSRRSHQLERSSGRWHDDLPAPSPLPPSSIEPVIESIPEPLKKPSQELKRKPSQVDKLSSAEVLPEPEHGASYNFDVDSVPPIRSLSPQEMDNSDEPDQLFEDYNQAQSIRRSAMRRKTGEQAAKSEEASPPRGQDEPTPAYNMLPISSTEMAFVDPFTYLEDELPPPPHSEQRGSVMMDQLDSGLHPIPETPVSRVSEPGMENVIEDLGDLGRIEAFPGRSPLIEEGVDEVPPPSAPPVRPSKRSVPLSPRLRSEPEPIEPKEISAFQREEIEDQPTIVFPQRPAVEGWRSSEREQPVHSRAVRPASGVTEHPNQVRPSSRQSQASQRPAGRRTGPTTARSRRSIVQSGRQKRSGLWVAVSIIFVLLIVALVAYFVPSADVTITFTGRSYSHAVTLVASQNGVVGPASSSSASVPAQSFSRDFDQDGSGTATGSKMVDNRTATGSVTFTNTGNTNITIPSGTIVETQNGIQFATTAEAVVTTSGSGLNVVDMPIQAVKPGASGNVGPGKITVLTDEGKDMIVRSSHLSSPNQLKLKLTNSSATTDGGSGKVTVVAQDDLNNVTKKLQDALSDDIQAWLSQLKKSSQDVVGKPHIESTLTDAPKEGVPVESNIFPAHLRAHVLVMVVRANDIQKASIAPLNTFLIQEKNQSDYTISPDAASSIQIQDLKTSGEGAALTLNFTAQASTTPSMSIEAVQRLISGKSDGAARDDILRTYRNLNVRDVQITNFPSFVSWTPFWPPHINIHLVPVK
ncbi:baseplate J/gp47 family protein [Ktedonospora formicarum]|nr:baseplate J/gp47 family protein [Ktedonospora formicarum]